MPDYFVCPNCYAEVPWDAAACPECGADENTGWSEDADYAHLLPYPDNNPYAGDDPSGDAISLPVSVNWRKLALAILVTITLSAFLATNVPWGVYIVPVLLLVAGILYVATERFKQTEYSVERDLYKNLLAKARGDEELVERWIGYERHRNPDADRIDHLEAAIYRWERRG